MIDHDESHGGTVRVLIANHTPVHGSGSGTYILALATGLARRGHDIALQTPPGGTPVPLPPGIRHFKAWELAGEFPSFTGHPCSSRLYSQMSSDDLSAVTLAWERALESVVRAWAPTVVHSQHLWLLTSAALGLGQTVVATCHGSECPYLDAERPRHRRFQDGKGSPAAVVSISHFVRRAADDHLAARTPHVVIPNPYDAGLFFHRPRPATDRPPRIAFVNRLVAYKRGDRFLEITRGLVDLVPGLEAWIIGDGTERPALEHLAASLGLGRTVRFLGFRPLASMPDTFHELDALVMCSPSEPFGLAAIEAACGTPVFVPDRGGLGELAVDPFIRSADDAPAAAPLATPPRPTRDEVVSAILAEAGDAYLLSTTGYLSRSLFNRGDRSRNFYMQGSMGHVAGIALGAALANPHSRFVVLDGDGAVLLHMGSLATIGDISPANLTHVVFDNGVYDSTGGQRTGSRGTDLAAAALACGYRDARTVDTVDALRAALRAALTSDGPSAVVVRGSPGGPAGERASSEVTVGDIGDRFRRSLATRAGGADGRTRG